MHRLVSALIATLALAAPACAAAATSISLDIRDLDVYDAVRLLSTQASVNVVVDASVQHRPITLRLRDVGFDEALATLARMQDLASARIGSAIYLATPEALNRRYRDASAARTQLFTTPAGAAADLARTLVDALPPGTLVAPDEHASAIVVTGSEPALKRAAELVESEQRVRRVRSETIPMRFARSADVVKAVGASLTVAAPQSVYAAEQQNALVATGTDEFLERVETLCAQLDRPGRQVRYEVRVTDISPSDTSDIGVLWGGLDLTGVATPGQTSTAFATRALPLNATINALITKGEASILAQPTLSTLNNVQASLLVGQQFPIVYFDARTGTQQVQFVNVGVNLTVTPSVGSDGTITTDLETDYSTIVNFVNNFPVIGTRRAQSTLRVRDGDSIVIAGLFSDLDTSTLSKVPLLGDLPLFGELFKSRSRTHSKDEVVFLITPHLVVEP
jgi:type IV pilus assembly protein PilQ